MDDQNPGFVWPDHSLLLPGVPPAILERIDPSQLNYETWAGSEVSSRSATQYVSGLTAGGVATVTFPAPDAGDTVTRGVCQHALTTDPLAVKGALRLQSTTVIAADGFGSSPRTFWGQRFRMQSLVPDGTNYELNAGGLALRVGSTTNNYVDGIFLWYDRTLGVVSWVLRMKRAGAPADIDLSVPWDNAYHTMGFLHTGDEVQAFVDGNIVDGYDGAEIQPATEVGPVSWHLVTQAAAVNNPEIQSDWVAWGPSR